MAPPTASLTLVKVLDKAVMVRASLAGLSGNTMVQARLVIADGSPAPIIIDIVDKPATTTSEAVNNLTSLFLGVPVDLTISDLINGVPINVVLQAFGSDNSTGTTVIATSQSVPATPFGPPAAPVLLSDTAISATSFSVRVARQPEGLDGGRPITTVLFSLSNPTIANGTVVNGIITQGFAYPNTPNADGSYPLYYDFTFGSAQGIVADVIYEVVASFVNAAGGVSSLSNALLASATNLPTAPTNISVSNSNASSTINNTAPSNASIELMKGAVLFDQSPTPKNLFFKLNLDRTFSPCTETELELYSGIHLQDSKPDMAIKVSGLNNYTVYSYKLAYVSVNGIGALTPTITLNPENPPAAPTATALGPAIAADFTGGVFAAAQTAFDSASSPFSSSTSPKVDFYDPDSKWVEVSTTIPRSYITWMQSYDDNESAREAALKAFMLPTMGGLSDQRTTAEKAWSDDQVLAKITAAVVGVTAAQWSGLSGADQLKQAGGSIALKQSLNEFYKVKAANLTTFNGINSSAPYIMQGIIGTNSYSTATIGPRFLSAGTTCSIRILTIVQIGGAAVTGQQSNSSIPPHNITNYIKGELLELLDIQTANSAAQFNATGLGFSAVAGNKDILVTITRAKNDNSLTPAIMTLVLDGGVNGIQSKPISYVETTDGYMPTKQVLSLKELGFSVSNNVAYYVACRTEPFVDPYTKSTTQMVTVNEAYVAAVTPLGKPAAPSIKNFITSGDKAQVQLSALSAQALDGATFVNYELYFMKASVMSLSDAEKLTPPELDNIGAIASNYFSKVSITSNTNFESTGYIIDAANYATGQRYTAQQTVAYGAQVWLMAKTNALMGGQTVSSTWVLSTQQLATSGTPSPPTSVLLAAVNNGSLAATWTLPSDDGKGGGMGAYLQSQTITLWNSGLAIKQYTVGGQATAGVIPSSDVVIGNYYTVTLTATTKSGISSVPSAASNSVSPAKPIVIQSAELLPNRQTLMIDYAANGSDVQNALIAASYTKGDGTVGSLVYTQAIAAPSHPASPLLVTVPTGAGQPLPSADSTMSGGIAILTDGFGTVAYKAF